MGAKKETGKSGDRHFVTPCHWGEIPIQEREGRIRKVHGQKTR